MTLSTRHRREIYALLALLFVLSAGVIWIRTSTVKDTYLYVQQEKEYRQLQQEIQATRVRWLKLTSPRRLEELATRVGLQAPKMNQILRYEPEKRAIAAAQ